MFDRTQSKRSLPIGFQSDDSQARDGVGTALIHTKVNHETGNTCPGRPFVSASSRVERGRIQTISQPTAVAPSVPSLVNRLYSFVIKLNQLLLLFNCPLKLPDGTMLSCLVVQND